MVNKFVKAGILTILIIGSWFFFSSFTEGERNNTLIVQIDNVIAEEAAVSSYLDYLESTNNTERLCNVLEEHIGTQNDRLFSLLGILERARQNTFNNQYELVRRRFQSANSQLFFSLKRFEHQCPEQKQPLTPILYFFSDLENCGDCTLQAQILDELGETCKSSIQIFAFPVEGGIEPIKLLVTDYNITVAPSLVIGDSVFPGVQSPSLLNEKLNCKN
jgi:hypothetical protein